MNRSVCKVAAIAAAVGFLAACNGDDSPDVEMATVAAPTAQAIDASPSSPIFGAADRLVAPMDLSAYGYVEREYFLSGKANVYDLDATGGLVVKSIDVPYVNRIIMRWPRNKADFSGNVIVEINNASALVDKPVVWAESHDYFVRNGDAYVAVTSKPVSVRSIKTFNPQRYAALSWPNPQPQACANLPPDSTVDMENGLVWDIISQAGVFVRDESAANPLAAAGLTVKQVYLTGQSQSANMTRTYYNNFHVRARLAGGAPIFNGYLAYASSGVSQPINNCATTPSGSDPRNQERVPTDVPLIHVQSQSPSELFGSFPVRREDSDEPTSRFRRIEVAGSSHLDFQLFLNQPQDADVLAAGRALQQSCVETLPGNSTGTVVSDFPMHYIINSALKNLDVWSRSGVAPPKAPRLSVLNAGLPSAAVERDVLGNAVGGLRTPYLDAPVATYTGSSTSPPANCNLIGYKTPFTAIQLHSLYPTKQSYVAIVTSTVDKLVADKWLLPADAQSIKDAAVKQAIP